MCKVKNTKYKLLSTIFLLYLGFNFMNELKKMRWKSSLPSYGLHISHCNAFGLISDSFSIDRNKYPINWELTGGIYIFCDKLLRSDLPTNFYRPNSYRMHTVRLKCYHKYKKAFMQSMLFFSENKQQSKILGSCDRASLI